MAVNYTANDVITIAKQQIGYLEKSSNSNLDSATGNAGYNNFNKFARDLDNNTDMYNGRKNGCEWCDVFVDWCHYQAAIKTGGTWHDAQEALCQPDKSAGAGCYYSYQYYKNAGRASTKPLVGAQIFFLSGGEISHTGLVYAVDNSYVYTIEGNTSGASGVISNGGGVCAKKYAINSSYIYGYGLPKYADVSSNPVDYAEPDTASNEIVIFSAPVKYQNGSTDEICYADTGFILTTGSLNTYEACDCIGKIGDKYIVVYDLDGTDQKKIGLVEYSGKTGK